MSVSACKTQRLNGRKEEKEMKRRRKEEKKKRARHVRAHTQWDRESWTETARQRQWDRDIGAETVMQG